MQITSLSNICYQIDKYTYNDKNAQISQHVISGKKEIYGIFSKSCLIIQAENEKDKQFVFMQLLTMQ